MHPAYKLNFKDRLSDSNKTEWYIIPGNPDVKNNANISIFIGILNLVKLINIINYLQFIQIKYYLVHISEIIIYY